MDFISHQAEKILACYTDSSLNSCINKAEENDIEKGGEGSRGGKVVGHTKSGKPIYESASGAHSSRQHKDFTEQDHQDAAEQHFKKWSEHKKANEADRARSEINQVGWHNQQGEKKRKEAQKAAAPSKEAHKSSDKIDRYRSDRESANEGDLDSDKVEKKYTKRTKDTHKKEIESGKSERLGLLHPDSEDGTEVHRTSDGEYHTYNPDTEEYRTIKKGEEIFMEDITEN